MIRLLFAAAALIPAALAFQQDAVTRTLPGSEGVKKSSRRLSAEGRAEAEKALGAKLSDADAAEAIWEGTGVIPEAGGNTPVEFLWVAVTVAGPKGKVRIGVARAMHDPIVGAVAVLENADEAAAADAQFLRQFEGMVLSDCLKQSPETLAAARKAEGLPQTLQKLQAAMHDVGAAWGKLEHALEKEDASAAGHAEAVAASLEKARPLVALCDFLSDSQRERFLKQLDKSKEQADSALASAKAARWAEASRNAHEWGETCSTCHSGMRRRFRQQRADLGLGNGNFALDLDVTATSPDQRELQQAVASGIRRALLILEYSQ